MLAAAAVLFLVVAAAVIVRLRGPGAETIHDRAAVPERFATCGRWWHDPQPVRTMAEIRAIGMEPVIVDTAPFGPCPAGMHPTPLSMATSVYVRVADDGYVEYDLVGGP